MGLLWVRLLCVRLMCLVRLNLMIVLWRILVMFVVYLLLLRAAAAGWVYYVWLLLFVGLRFTCFC